MKRAGRLALAAGAAIGALAVQAAIIEPRNVELTRPRVRIRDLPDALVGLRVGLLSDLHAGRLTPRSTLDRAVALLMDASPDVIALTGDFADRRRADYAPAFRALEPLRAPLGVFAVPGNHDHAVGIDAWHRALRSAPHVLDATNRFYMRTIRGVRLCIAGADDLQEGEPRLELPPAKERDFTLLLAHNPETAERVRRAGDAIDLTVAGHTHGGQIRLPLIGPIERKSAIYDEGLRRRPWTQVYTSRGVGSTVLPLRLGARPEAAVLELIRA